MSSPFPVISSEVERSGSARLLPEGRKKSHEISPCASLSRDDWKGEVWMTGMGMWLSGQ